MFLSNCRVLQIHEIRKLHELFRNVQTTSPYLNQRWLVNWRIYVSVGPNELSIALVVQKFTGWRLFPGDVISLCHVTSIVTAGIQVSYRKRTLFFVISCNGTGFASCLCLNCILPIDWNMIGSKGWFNHIIIVSDNGVTFLYTGHYLTNDDSNIYH